MKLSPHSTSTTASITNHYGCITTLAPCELQERHDGFEQLPVVLALEDDGRVAYAYLEEHGKIVADVWLYNVAETPETDNLSDHAHLPLLNPKRYCKPGAVKRITEQSRIACTLSVEHVEIPVEGHLTARLKPGAKPGWSKLAACDGPLARALMFS